MTLYDLFEDLQRKTAQRERATPRFRIAASLAAAMVPVHGFVVSSGAIASAPSRMAIMKSQVKSFFGQLIKGCLWAAAIAAGMLVYTSFTAKWKEKGWPTIPISALVAADQAIVGGPRQTAIPLGGAGSQYSSNGVRTSAGPSSSQSRQASLLDMDQYEG